MHTQDTHGIPVMMMEDIPTEKITDGGPKSPAQFDADIVAHQRAQLRRIMFETTREIPCLTETE